MPLAASMAAPFLKEQWHYLTNYLMDGKLEIPNNLTERSIKPSAIDRKNLEFANTTKGANGTDGKPFRVHE